MSHSRWNITVLSMLVMVAAATAAVNCRLNFYGLFGDVRGKKYLIYDNERTSKYLLSYNYIPRNFDGLLIGSSASANWNTASLTGIRMYNASISGGNISEEALIAHNVFRQGRPRLVVFLIYPYLTLSYGRKSGFMNPQEFWGALGSVQLLRGYCSKWMVEHGHGRIESDDFGTDDFVVPPRRLPAQLAQGMPTQTESFIEPRAFQEYRDLIERARATGARIAAVVPPMELQIWKTMRPQMDDYLSKIRPLFRDTEPILDLTGPEMDQFRENPDNYQDGIHLSKLGAKSIMQVIGNWLSQTGMIGDAATYPCGLGFRTRACLGAIRP